MTSASQSIRTLYDGLNRRSLEAMWSVCHSEVEIALVTGKLAGRAGPYRGHQGIRDYLTDLDSVWDELLVTPVRIEQQAGEIRVRGRVYARSRTVGILDLPVVWVWEERDGLLYRGAVVEAPGGLTVKSVASGG